MAEEYTTVEHEYDWNDVISNEGSDFTLLPEGVYPFTVTKFERGRSKGSDKLPPCNMAILTLKVTAPNGDTTTITDQLVLHTKMEWKLCAFFRALGLKKHDEPLRMNWQAVPGASGRCKVIVEKWTGRNGEEKESNRIDKYLDPDEVVTPQQTPPASSGQKSFW